MSVIIRGLSGLSKKIKDATITPAKVLQGEIGYGNNHERIVGTHVCKKHFQVMKVSNGESISMANTSSEPMETYDRALQYGQSGKYAPIESGDMSVSKDYDNIAIWEPQIQGNNSTYCTVIKKQSVSVRYGPDTNLFITVNGVRLNIFLGKPFDDSYRYIDPLNFTSKNIFELKQGLSYVEVNIGNPEGSRKRLSFYLKTDNGIITEFGLAMDGGTSQNIYINYDIEFGIEWI